MHHYFKDALTCRLLAVRRFQQRRVGEIHRHSFPVPLSGLVFVFSKGAFLVYDDAEVSYGRAPLDFKAAGSILHEEVDVLTLALATPKPQNPSKMIIEL